MSTDPRSIATDLIRSAARDIDTMGISEYLEGRDIDDPGAGITEQVDELIRAASVTVDWPQAGAGALIGEPDLATWCRERAANHRTYEQHELPLYVDRDVALVEWTVRVLGNPLTAQSVEALRILAERHGLELHSAGELEQARAEGRRQAASGIERMDHLLGDAGWQHLENKAVEASYPAEAVRRRRSRDDFTTDTIEAAYQYGYRQAAKVARGAA